MQPGFLIYADDWLVYAEEYSAEEIGKMVKALLSYFCTGEHTEFADRGMRQFFRQATKAIDLDRARYEKKCLQNAYNRYKGICKQRNENPLSFEEWLTTVDERHEPSPIPIINTNNQQSITNNHYSTVNTQESERMQGETQRDQENAFERKRQAALAALGYE